MNSVIHNITSRRSIRSFREELILDVELNEILRAAVFAPTDFNRQSYRLTVLLDKEKIRGLNDLIEAALVKKALLSQELESMNGGILYNPPVFIIVSNEGGHSHHMADCACVLQNIMLSAHSLGIGACWISELAMTCRDSDVRTMLTYLEIPEEHDVYGAISLGYPNSLHPETPLRKQGIIKIIR